MQAEQLTTNLTRSGVWTDEFVFSAAGPNRLARSLLGALRDRSLSLPDDPETRTDQRAGWSQPQAPCTARSS
jgi:hypothetical protein